METARYGRMRVGRCLATTYYVGCNADVLPVMDSICSGRSTCSIKPLDTELVKFHPCRKDLMPYLEAQYTCISSESFSYMPNNIILSTATKITSLYTHAAETQFLSFHKDGMLSCLFYWRHV